MLVGNKEQHWVWFFNTIFYKNYIPGSIAYLNLLFWNWSFYVNLISNIYSRCLCLLSLIFLFYYRIERYLCYKCRWSLQGLSLVIWGVKNLQLILKISLQGNTYFLQNSKILLRSEVIAFWTSGLPEGVICNHPCPSVSPWSVFKYLRDSSKDFSNFLHEVSAP